METSGTQSLMGAFRLVREIAECDPTGVTLSELVRTTGLTKPTAHRLLSALLEQQLLCRDKSGRFHIGEFAYDLGVIASARYRVRELCSLSMARLMEETQQQIYLVTRKKNDSFCLDRRIGASMTGVRETRLANRRPLGAASSGVALLAALPEGELNSIMHSNRARLEDYPGGWSVAEKNLRESRERGYAKVGGAVTTNGVGLSVAVLDFSGQPVAAITIATNCALLTQEKESSYVYLLQRERRLIEKRLITEHGGALHREPPPRVYGNARV